MTRSRVRYVALALSAVSLLNGLVLAVAHYHCDRQAADSAVVTEHASHAGRSCDTSGPEHRHDRESPADHSHPADECLVCRYLAQSNVLPDLEPAAGVPQQLGWTEIVSSDSTVAIRIAMFDVRGPPA